MWEELWANRRDLCTHWVQQVTNDYISTWRSRLLTWKNICKQNIDKLKWNWNKDTQYRWNCFWPEKGDIWPVWLPFLSHLLLGFFSFGYPLLLSFQEAAKPPAISCRDLEFISQSRAVKVLILLLRFNSPSRTDFFSMTQHYSSFIVFSDAKTFEEFSESIHTTDKCAFLWQLKQVWKNGKCLTRLLEKRGMILLMSMRMRWYNTKLGFFMDREGQLVRQHDLWHSAFVHSSRGKSKQKSVTTMPIKTK